MTRVRAQLSMLRTFKNLVLYPESFEHPRNDREVRDRLLGVSHHCVVTKVLDPAFKGEFFLRGMRAQLFMGSDPVHRWCSFVGDVLQLADCMREASSKQTPPLKELLSFQNLRDFTMQFKNVCSAAVERNQVSMFLLVVRLLPYYKVGEVAAFSKFGELRNKGSLDHQGVTSQGKSDSLVVTLIRFSVGRTHLCDRRGRRYHRQHAGDERLKIENECGPVFVHVCCAEGVFPKQHGRHQDRSTNSYEKGNNPFRGFRSHLHFPKPAHRESGCALCRLPIVRNTSTDLRGSESSAALKGVSV